MYSCKLDINRIIVLLSNKVNSSIIVASGRPNIASSVASQTIGSAAPPPVESRTKL